MSCYWCQSHFIANLFFPPVILKVLFSCSLFYFSLMFWRLHDFTHFVGTLYSFNLSPKITLIFKIFCHKHSEDCFIFIPELSHLYLRVSSSLLLTFSVGIPHTEGYPPTIKIFFSLQGPVLIPFCSPCFFGSGFLIVMVVWIQTSNTRLIWGSHF